MATEYNTMATDSRSGTPSSTPPAERPFNVPETYRVDSVIGEGAYGVVWYVYLHLVSYTILNGEERVEWLHRRERARARLRVLAREWTWGWMRLLAYRRPENGRQWTLSGSVGHRIVDGRYYRRIAE